MPRYFSGTVQAAAKQGTGDHLARGVVHWRPVRPVRTQMLRLPTRRTSPVSGPGELRWAAGSCVPRLRTPVRDRRETRPVIVSTERAIWSCRVNSWAGVRCPAGRTGEQCQGYPVRGIEPVRNELAHLGQCNLLNVRSPGFRRQPASHGGFPQRRCKPRGGLVFKIIRPTSAFLPPSARRPSVEPIEDCL